MPTWLTCSPPGRGQGQGAGPGLHGGHRRGMAGRVGQPSWGGGAALTLGGLPEEVVFSLCWWFGMARP